MNTMRSLKAAAAVAICLLPLPALADDDDFDVSNAPAKASGPPPSHNQITQLPLPPPSAVVPPAKAEIILGGGWQSNVGIRFGRFNGMSDSGFIGLAGFTLKGGDAWDSGDTFYYEAQGLNLGLSTREVSVKFGRQGSWGANFFYNGMTDYYSNSFQSVWTTAGTLVPGVTPGSVKNATTLAPLLQVEDIKTQRDIIGGSAKAQYGDWLVTAGVRHEHKSGYKENSLAILGAPSPLTGNTNITSSALAYFAEPVNYDTDRYDISAQYTTGPLQLLFGYTFNNFTDNNASLNLANPFQFSAGTGVTGSAATAAAGSANVTSIYSLPPSNSAHQFRVQAGFNVSPTTRINTNLQYGLMMQNAAYVPGTGNANVVAPTPTASSYNGLIQTIHGNVALTTQPFANSDLKVSYTIDDRRNASPRNQYTSYYQDAFSAAPITPWSLPQSYDHQTFDVQGGYRLTPQTKLSAGYTYETTHRTYADTNDVEQQTVNAKVRSTLTDNLFVSLGVSHEDRRANNYGRNNPWQALGIAENEFFGFVNYYLASRRREEVKTTIDYAITNNLTATLIGKADVDTYPNSQLGLKDNNNFSIGPDLSYQIASNMSVHGYYTYQMLFFNQSSAVTNAFCNGNGQTLTAPGAPCTSNGAWTGKNTDTTHTAGMSFDWQATEALKISTDYIFSYGRNAYSIANGGIYSFIPAGTASLQVAPIPDVKSMLNSIGLRGEYQINPSTSIWFGYNFERLVSKDYGTQAGAAQFSNALFSSDAGSGYSVHQVLAALRMKW